MSSVVLTAEEIAAVSDFNGVVKDILQDGAIDALSTTIIESLLAGTGYETEYPAASGKKPLKDYSRAVAAAAIRVMLARIGAAVGSAMDQGSPNTPSHAWPTKVVDSGGSNVAAVDSSGRQKVDGSSVTQPISAASLPLPSGAATAANQATANTALAHLTDTTQQTRITDGIGSVGVTSGALNVAPGFQDPQDTGSSGYQATSGGMDSGVARPFQMRGAPAVSGDYGLVTRHVGAVNDGENTTDLPILMIGGTLSGSDRARMARILDTDPAPSELGILVRNIPGSTPQKSSIYDSAGSNALDIDVSGSALVRASSLPLPSGAATETSLARPLQTDGGSPTGSHVKIGGVVSSSAPSPTNGTATPLSIDSAGSLRVRDEHLVLPGAAFGLVAPIGGDNGSSKIAIPAALATTLSGSEMGLVVRSIPHGTLPQKVDCAGSIVRTQSYDLHTQQFTSGLIDSITTVAGVQSLAILWHPSACAVNFRILTVDVSWAGGKSSVTFTWMKVLMRFISADGSGGSLPSLFSFDRGYTVNANTIWRVGATVPGTSAAEIASAAVLCGDNGSMRLYEQSSAQQGESIRCRTGVSEGIEIVVITDASTAQTTAQKFNANIQYVEN